MGSPLPSIPVKELAVIGRYFTLGTAGADSGTAGADSRGWRRACELIDDADHLREVIDDVAARLGTTQRWIAASIFYQGWAARLTSIYAGSAIVCGAVPDLRACLVRYRQRRPGPVELSVVHLRALSTDAGWRHLHHGHLAPLAAAIRGQVRIGGYLLRGNAASALAGALAVLAQVRREPLESLIGQGWARPAEHAPCGLWVTGLYGPRYARQTCCGYEQLEHGGRCGDCSLSWRRSLRPGGGLRA